MSSTFEAVLNNQIMKPRNIFYLKFSKTRLLIIHSQMISTMNVKAVSELQVFFRDSSYKSVG